MACGDADAERRLYLPDAFKGDKPRFAQQPNLIYMRIVGYNLELG